MRSCAGTCLNSGRARATDARTLANKISSAVLQNIGRMPARLEGDAPPPSALAAMFITAQSCPFYKTAPCINGRWISAVIVDVTDATVAVLRLRVLRICPPDAAGR